MEYQGPMAMQQLLKWQLTEKNIKLWIKLKTTSDEPNSENEQDVETTGKCEEPDSKETA